MSIIGCYTLDLYCENDKPVGEVDLVHSHNEFPHSFCHESGSVCRKRARKTGWRLNLKEGKAVCPKCNKK